MATLGGRSFYLPVLQMGKQRHRAVKQFILEHTAILITVTNFYGEPDMYQALFYMSLLNPDNNQRWQLVLFLHTVEEEIVSCLRSPS